MDKPTVTATPDAQVQSVRIDASGRILNEAGELVIIAGLEPKNVLEGLSDLDSGRVRPLS